MLEIVESLGAAFLWELGAAELMAGLLFAVGLVGCALRGRDRGHSNDIRPAQQSSFGNGRSRLRKVRIWPAAWGTDDIRLSTPVSNEQATPD